VGTQQTLSAVWSHYSIYAQAYQRSVNHSLATYVIDSQEHERVLLDNTFTPDQMAANIQQLLKA
jgi:cytochrome oxidase Cu insertion factor (SCO1/SenC/PrrC family)